MYKNYLVIVKDKILIDIFWFDTEEEAVSLIESKKILGYNVEAFKVNIEQIYQDGFKNI